MKLADGARNLVERIRDLRTLHTPEGMPDYGHGDHYQANLKMFASTAYGISIWLSSRQGRVTFPIDINAEDENTSLLYEELDELLRESPGYDLQLGGFSQNGEHNHRIEARFLQTHSAAYFINNNGDLIRIDNERSTTPE